MTKQEEIREGIAVKLSIYACEAAWSLLGSLRKQVYLDQALSLIEYEDSVDVVLKVEREEPQGCSIVDKTTAVCPYKEAGYAATESLV